MSVCHKLYCLYNPIGSLILNRLPAFGVILPLLCLGHSPSKMEKAKEGSRRGGESGGEKKTDRKTQLKRREEKKW